MRLKFKVIYLIGIVIALLLFGVDYYLLFGTRWFWAGIVICLNIAWVQFWIDFFKENKRQKEIELKFLEFIRNLVSSVKSGIAIPRSVVNVSAKDYGALNPYVKKLANQVSIGIPINRCFVTFADDTDNDVIKRSIAIIIEAEKSGGDIADVLESVSDSVVNVKKMRAERRSSVYSQIVQGYIVYFVFIAIMLILQLWLFPRLAEMSGSLQSGLGGIGGLVGGRVTMAAEKLDRIFFILIMIQGFFAGIMIGKFSEGNLRQGLLHSLILMMLAALIITTAKGGI